MLFVRFIRFIRGAVTFTLTGGFIERFLNLSARSGLPIWGAVRERDTTTATTTPKSYRAMRTVAKKTGVRMRIKEKTGLPFFVVKYQKRKGILIGLFLCVSFFFGMSRFIWNVEITGNETLPTDYLIQNLLECGVYEGAYKGSIDTLKAENEMLLCTPKLSWIAINLRASTATVQVKEREVAPELIDDGSPCNVIAARTGQIVEMEVYDGAAALAVGDTVQEGELLVNAYMDGITEKGRGYFVHARARVIAEFVQDVEISVPLSQELRTPTGEVVSKRKIELLGAAIPLYFKDTPKGDYSRASNVSQIKLFGRGLPVFIATEQYTMQTVTQTQLSESEAREVALLKLQQYEQDFSKVGTIEGKTASGNTVDGQYVINAQFTLRQDIARQKSIEINDTGKRPPGAPK